MKLTGAAILVSRGRKVLQAAPAAYPYRSAAWQPMFLGADPCQWSFETMFPIVKECNMLLRQSRLSVICLTLMLCVAPPTILAQDGQPKIIQRWQGIIKEEGGRKHIPADYFILEQKTFKKLWKAWRPDEKKPTVDFSKHLIVVVTDRLESFSPTLWFNKDGNLEIGFKTSVENNLPAPAFSYHILVVPREGIKTIQGKAVNTDGKALKVEKSYSELLQELDQLRKTVERMEKTIKELESARTPK
jgi:hypothetical protein